MKRRKIGPLVNVDFRSPTTEKIIGRILLLIRIIFLQPQLALAEIVTSHRLKLNYEVKAQ